MKKLLPILLLTSLLLSACSVDWTGEKDAKIAELEKQVKTISFEKQKECANFEKEMKKQIDELSIFDDEVTHVFYSPKRNSCLYTTLYLMNNTLAFMGIQDFFTKETVYSRKCDLKKGSNLNEGKDFEECESIFNDKVAELRQG